MPKLIPPVEAEYQLYVPAQPVADNDTVPVPHRLPAVVVGAEGIFTIVAMADTLDALVQPLTVQST